MKKLIMGLISSVIVLCSVMPAYADIMLTDEEYQLILDRLKKDKEIIHNNHIRWNSLKNVKPKIKYEVVDGKVVIQSVEIPIYKSSPLIYEVKFEVKAPEEKVRLFPWTLHLCGMYESFEESDGSLGMRPDVKIGLQFFSLRPFGERFKMKYLNIGFNLLAGIRSTGFSMSYYLPKPLKNTAAHVYAGITYSGHKTYGLGISLNF